MIAPRSSGYASVMSASRPMAAGVAPARTNRPPAATASSTSRMASASVPTWLIAIAAASITAPPVIPYRMIVVRRIDLNLPPQ